MPVKSNIISVIITFFLLTSCQRAIKSPTKEPTAIPPTITLTPTITTSPTFTPRFLPNNVGFAMEESVAHVEPTLADMEIVPNTGKSVREELLDAGITEETIALYENAGYAWALASGFDESSPVTVEEIANGLFGNDFHWQMVFRSLDRGNILWAQSQDGTKYNLFPTIVKVDATGVHRDPAWKAVELHDTKDVAVIFINGVYPVAVRIPVTGADRNEYYSEWFDTLTGEWVKDSAVEAIPKALYREDFPNSPDDFTLTTNEGKKAIIQDIIDHPTLPEPQESYYPHPISVYPEGNLIILRINCKIGFTCAWRGWVRVADPVNGPDRRFGELEVHNKGDTNSHVVDLYLDADMKDYQNYIQGTLYRLYKNTSGKGDMTTFFIPIQSRNWIKWDNPVLAEIVDGGTPERRKELDTLQKTLKVLDSISDAPLWLFDTTLLN
jgi:hypothetical protein